jgi:hypothetical protein
MEECSQFFFGAKVGWNYRELGVAGQKLLKYLGCNIA